MAPKHRNPNNQHLAGTNIKKWAKGDKTYYYYIKPDGTSIPLAHDDEKTSIEVAIVLNQKFRDNENIYDRINKISADPALPPDINPPLVQLVDKFRDEWIPKQNYKSSGIVSREQKLKKWQREWPHKKVNEMTTFIVASFLNQLTNESARQHSILFNQFFRWCASNGYDTQRPMLDIEKRKQLQRKRQRHTWEGFKKIYDASPDWLKIAQDAALYSLQRRGDLVNLSFIEHIDIKTRTVTVAQEKSENYNEQVFIKIAMGDELYDTVMRSHWSGINCPYLVHCRPKRITKTSREAKPHPFYVTADYLTRHYSAVRDAVGVYNHLPKIERPGLHSIRALGIWLYSKAGYDSQYIMALAGHANEKMKEHYEDGHEVKPPVNVEAGLSLNQVDLTSINWETDLSSDLKKLIDIDD